MCPETCGHILRPTGCELVRRRCRKHGEKNPELAPSGPPDSHVESWPTSSLRSSGMSADHHPAVTRTTGGATAPALEQNPERGPLGSGPAAHPTVRRTPAAPRVPDERDEEVTIRAGEMHGPV
ncbi:hypothetical protein CGC20_19185 [Leishmania donovani]|uniref:Uncharacterized protein n=1 Tax=Leishmania donovani TaxID=5661 RepID=A0A504XU29_LEIDO|nr:hypothetical protein CGC20_19185 [Leishmania donovani]